MANQNTRICVLLALFGCQVGSAQLRDYYSVLYGGEGTYECIRLRFDGNNSSVSDTLLVLSTLLDALPDTGVSTSAEIRDLFSIKAGRPIRLISSRVTRDSVYFLTEQYLYEGQEMWGYRFSGRRYKNKILGSLVDLRGSEDRVVFQQATVRGK